VSTGETPPCTFDPTHLPEADDAGMGLWQKLMVYAGEQDEHDGHPLYVALLRRLRAEGAAGATALTVGVRHVPI
jgi:hypothetical protein